MDLGHGFSIGPLFQPIIRRIQNRTLPQIFTPGIIARIAQNQRSSVSRPAQAPKMWWTRKLALPASDAWDRALGGITPTAPLSRDASARCPRPWRKGGHRSGIPLAAREPRRVHVIGLSPLGFIRRGTVRDENARSALPHVCVGTLHGPGIWARKIFKLRVGLRPFTQELCHYLHCARSCLVPVSNAGRRCKEIWWAEGPR
jgi:hypothetical protein